MVSVKLTTARTLLPLRAPATRPNTSALEASRCGISVALGFTLAPAALLGVPPCGQRSSGPRRAWWLMRAGRVGWWAATALLTGRTLQASSLGPRQRQRVREGSREGSQAAACDPQAAAGVAAALLRTRWQPAHARADRRGQAAAAPMSVASDDSDAALAAAVAGMDGDAAAPPPPLPAGTLKMLVQGAEDLDSLVSVGQQVGAGASAPGLGRGAAGRGEPGASAAGCGAA